MDAPKEKLTESTARPQRQLGRIAMRALVATVLVVLASLALLPAVFSYTSLKDHLLAVAFADKDVEVRMDRLLVSWFAPIQVQRLQLDSRSNTSNAKVDRVTSDAGLWGWIFRPSVAKRIDIHDLDLLIDIEESSQDADEPEEDAAQSIPFGGDGGQRDIHVALHNARVTIQGQPLPEPATILEQLELSGQLSRRGDETKVIIRPGKVAEEKKVSADICDAALKYVAPVVADTTWAEGSFSVALAEWQLTLGNPYATVGSGTLTIHSLETGIKSPLALQISRIISEVIGKQLPTTVKLADQSIIEFSMQDGRIRHEGMEFGLPELSPELLIRTRGTVGLDQTLDLMVEVPLPLQLLGDGPVAEALGNQTLYLPVRGTLDEPIVDFEGDGQLISDLLARLSQRAANGELDLQQWIDTIRQRREQRDPDQPTLLQRWRQRREQRRPLFRRRSEPNR